MSQWVVICARWKNIDRYTKSLRKICSGLQNTSIGNYKNMPRKSLICTGKVLNWIGCFIYAIIILYHHNYTYQIMYRDSARLQRNVRYENLLRKSISIYKTHLLEIYKKDIEEELNLHKQGSQLNWLLHLCIHIFVWLQLHLSNFVSGLVYGE
jgi:hypothetical protein